MNESQPIKFSVTCQALKNKILSISSLGHVRHCRIRLERSAALDTLATLRPGNWFLRVKEPQAQVGF